MPITTSGPIALPEPEKPKPVRVPPRPVTIRRPSDMNVPKP